MNSFEPDKIQFKALETADFPLIHRWLNTPFVAEWWTQGPVSLDEVNAEYSAYLDGSDPIRPFLVLYDSLPVGQVQTYKISDYPEWHCIIEPEEESAGVDIFIGHPDFIYRGLGSLILKKFIREIVFAWPGIEGCIIDPDPANQSAIPAYEKAGFKYWKTTLGGETPDSVSHIMRLTKRELL